MTRARGSRYASVMAFFRKNTAPRWVDSPVLDWTPERPFGWEPSASNDTGWTDVENVEPRAAVPQPQPVPPVEAAPVLLPAPLPTPLPQADAISDEAAPPAPANTNRAPSLLAQRLFIGLVQGVALFALTQARDIGLWPGSDPYLFAALSLALLFAPLVLLEGLGEIPTPTIASYAAIVAALLLSLGLYHHWRIQGAADQPHAGVALAILTALALGIAQALLHAGIKDGKILPTYGSCFDAAWTLAARLLVWAMLTAVAWALIGSGNSLLDWLRAHYPDIPPSMTPELLVLPLTGLASAAALHISGSRTRRQVKNALLACCTIALPLLIAACILVVAVQGLSVPLAESLGLALALLIAFNASYRGKEERGRWRKGAEFAAAFAITALTVLATAALDARVTAFGWSSARIYAAASIVVLGLYGALTTSAGLIAIGGGRWMQRIEIANRVMALVVIAGCLALLSPLADPAKLAVQAQAARLRSGAVDPAAFDFGDLRQGGLRFGHETLDALAHGPSPEIARDAAMTLAAPPDSDAPTPTEIGANITVRTPGARLPDTLLRQDWTGLEKDGAAVPPCLTRPALGCDAWFLDLDGDGLNEILLVYGSDARWWASVMKEDRHGGWRAAATLASPACRGSLSALRAGGMVPVGALTGWRDILVAGLRLTPTSAPQAALPCPK